MRNIILGVFILLASTQAQALTLNQWKSLVVKIKSFPCVSKKPEFEGSGVMVQKGNHFEVLTTDHVIIASADKELCHKAINPVIGTVDMSIKRYDYLNGMAVLESKAQFASVTLAQWTSEVAPLDEGNDVVALGVPAGTEIIHALKGGKMMATDSRSLIPLAESMYEVSQLPVEFGMSGGVLLKQTAEDSFEYAGMVTHQYLPRASSTITQPQMMDKQSASSTDLSLAIPAQAVNAWFEDSSSESTLDWSRRLTTSDRKVWTSYGPLLFGSTEVDSQLLKAPGNDGSGIGGSQGDALEGPQALELSLDKEWIKNNLSTKDLKKEELTKWYQWLLRGESLKIIAVAKIEESGEADLHFISSPEQFLTLWLRDKYTPIVWRNNINELDSDIAQMIKLARMVRENIQDIEHALAGELSADTLAWLNQLKAKTYLVENLYLSPLLFEGDRDNEEVWGQLYPIDWDKSTALQTSLIELVTGLRR